MCVCAKHCGRAFGLRLRLTLLSRRFPLSLQLPWTLTAAPSLGDRLAALKADRARLLREKADKSKETKTAQKRFKRLKKAAAKLSQEDLVELLRVKEGAGSSSSSEGQGRSGASALKPAPSSFSD